MALNFGRFTHSARQVMVHALNQARRLGHEYIGTEHLLLGVTDSGKGAAYEALVALGLDPDEIEARVEEVIGTGPGGSGFKSRTKKVITPLPFTPRTKTVIELSFHEAESRNQDHLGSDHLLLALMRDGDGVAAHVLKQMGLTLEDLEPQLERLSRADE